MDILNLDEMQKIITNGVLHQIWDEFDKDGKGVITQNDLKTMINKVLEIFVANLGIAYLLSEKHMQVMSETVPFS